MINDKHVQDAIELLDRINYLMFTRHYGRDPETPHEAVVWHRPEDILNAMSVIDMLKTRVMLDSMVGQAEMLRRARLDG